MPQHAELSLIDLEWTALVSPLYWQPASDICLSSPSDGSSAIVCMYVLHLKAGLNGNWPGSVRGGVPPLQIPLNAD